MSTRRRLPPGVSEVTLPSGAKRIEVVVDLDADPATGKRRQSRRRFKNIDDANAWRDETRAAVRKGTHVSRERQTARDAVETWLAGRRNIRATTLSGYRFVLRPVVGAYGGLSVQTLSKAHVDALVTELLAGTRPEQRKAWSPRSVNYMLGALSMVLDDLVRQGRLARNVAALVDRPTQRHREMPTWTAKQAEAFLRSVKGERMEVAWLLALYGMRRGEIAGLQWADVDLTTTCLTIRQTRVAVAGRAQASEPKSERGRRTLPLTDDLVAAFRSSRKRQAAERLAAGGVYEESGYVVVDERGHPLHPDTITDRWEAAVRDAKAPRIRLHDARHTCATLMHLRGVRTAVVSEWLGHASAAFTMQQYVHSQDEAKREAAGILGAALRGAVTSA